MEHLEDGLAKPQNVTVRNEVVRRPDRRPYGAEVRVELGSTVQFLVEGEFSPLIDSPGIVLLRPEVIQQPAYPSQRFVSRIEGYPTAGEAEQHGLSLARGWLWIAISLKCPLRLIYHTPLPCMVYDRTRSGGFGMLGSAHLLIQNNPALIAELLEEGMASSDPDDRLLLAMELFAAARLEATDRARFVGMVSALEPLASPELYGPDVEAFVNSAVIQLQGTAIEGDIRDSLIGRLKQLRHESISRAIRRVLHGALDADRGTRDILVESYEIRSELLHTGRTSRDLRDWLPATEDAMRPLFAGFVGMPLRMPANIMPPVT